MAAEALILVTVARTSGSVPREVGAWMTVTAGGFTGTVGGGHLEFDAIARSRAALAGGALDDEVRYALGPGLGQCCGGVVWLRFERVAAGVHGLEAREQPRVEVDRVLVRGELRRDLGLDLLDRRVGRRLGEVEEHLADARQQRAAALHCLDRVGERRRLGIGGDRLDLGGVLLHALEQGRQVVRVLDAVVETIKADGRSACFDSEEAAGIE